jgi:hypothetical protein
MKRAFLHGVVGLAVVASAVGWALEPAAPRPVEIHIDQHCRVVTQSQEDPTRLEFEEAPDMCHLEGRHDTQRMHPDGHGGEIPVSIHEQIYFLTDTLDQPVTFVVA